MSPLPDEEMEPMAFSRLKQALTFSQTTSRAQLAELLAISPDIDGEVQAAAVLQAMGQADTESVDTKELYKWLCPDEEPRRAGSKSRSSKDVRRMSAILDRTELKSKTEEAVEEFHQIASELALEFRDRADDHPTGGISTAIEQLCVEKCLANCVFVGHDKTDLDSVAGAIGAAYLFDGTPCVAEKEDKLNGEIKYALQFAELTTPTFYDDLPGAATYDSSGKLHQICLVDHTEEKQMTPALRADPDKQKRIVGVIDHHAIAQNFYSEKPPFMDIRPWGSMSTIVAHCFTRSNKPMPKGVARILLCAILSDTLNLQSVTTTDADRMMVTMLAILGEVESPDELARRMFKAKTQWIVNLGPNEMVRGDQKDFESKGCRFGIAVLEVTDPSPVLGVADALIAELQVLKVEKGRQKDGTQDPTKELHCAFIFVVDVTKQESVLLLCGEKELALAKAAFPERPLYSAKPGMQLADLSIQNDETLMDVGPKVSRKAEFLPAFFCSSC